MKPTFALDLTSEAIGLLHRTPKGWLSIGETAFDAPDLTEALDYLRKTALGLSPMGVATKLILPNSQILYTEIHAPGPSRDEKRRQIAVALEGRTPYAVDDLVFDWSGKGATVKVAVIARETLDQAEGFAAEHRLNPVSFVAIPEDGTFVGEPWFGPTAAAAGLLAEDETVERDRDPVTILHRELPKAEPVAEPVAEAAPAPVIEPPPADAPPSVAEDEPLP
ncbi:MAG: translation initiation factor 2, partial [Tabrizicola sp.]